MHARPCLFVACAPSGSRIHPPYVKLFRKHCPAESTRIVERPKNQGPEQLPWLFHRFRHRLSRGCPSLRSGIFIQAVFSSSYRFMLSVRLLRSTGITPLPRSYGPLRLPSGPPRRLCIPAGRWSLSLPPCRVSQAPRLIFPRALPPTTPESPAGACLLFPHRYQASS